MPRRGRPKPLGAAYGNRTDLPAQAPAGRPYGERKKLEEAQQAVPIQPTGPAAPPFDMAGAVAAAQGFGFESAGLGAPTGRPDEPVTAGLTRGPGPGPEALAGLTRGPGPGPEALAGSYGPNPVHARIRALYKADPNPDLLELLAYIDGTGGGAF